MNSSKSANLKMRVAGIHASIGAEGNELYSERMHKKFADWECCHFFGSKAVILILVDTVLNAYFGRYNSLDEFLI